MGPPYMVRTIPPYPTSHSLSFNEVQLKTMQAKIFKTLKKSQPQMEIYWLLQKTGAVVNDTVVQ